MQVALLAEGVDRNLTYNSMAVLNLTSPSSRRAWIEMNFHIYNQDNKTVALLAEGVDRNHMVAASRLCGMRSPSSRRAWIEMPV